MKANLFKKVELLANVAIIVVALLLGYVLVKRYVFPPPPGGGREEVKVGTKVAMTDVDWSRGDRNLVMVLQKGCHFCAESAPFYQRLAREASGRGDVRMIAALPQETSVAGQYLNDLGVQANEVRQVSPAALGAPGTPTLLLVDHTGTIKAAWVGKLSPEQESEVLRSLLG